MAETFYSKVAGVTKNNDDGTSRQEIIQEELKVGDMLFLDREPHNSYDRNAIAVVTSDFDKKIGYINSDLASRLAPLMDRGSFIDCHVADITGGGPRQSYGVNIRLTVNDPVKMADSTSTRKTSPKSKDTPLSDRWKTLPKKTRTWIIVIAIIILLYLCGSLTSCTPQIQEVIVTQIHTREVEVTREIEVTRLMVITATPLPPTPTAAFQEWSLEDAREAIIGEGLEFEGYYEMTKDDCGLAPMNAVEAWRFLIPSLCADCGGRIYSFDDPGKLATMKEYYDSLAEVSAMYFSWVFVQDNILIQINGDLPEAQALQYQQALVNMK